MPESEDLEPSDDELQELEAELTQADSDVVDINGGFVLYEMQSERIKLLASIIQAFNEPTFENIREEVEHELKLTLADRGPLQIAKLAGARAAREGISLA